MNVPLSNDYRPELDDFPELGMADAAYYQLLIGILRWIVELRRDTCCEVSMMSSHLALSREGHLDQVFHIFAYLKKHHNTRLVFEPFYPEIDPNTFEHHDWTKFYGNVKEVLPQNMPKTLGKEVVMRFFVDVDHTGERLTRRSRTWFIIFL